MRHSVVKGLAPRVAAALLTALVGAAPAWANRMSEVDFRRYTSDDPTVVFGVKADASPEEVKRAFRAAALATHPDTYSAATEGRADYEEAERKRVEIAFRHVTDMYESYQKAGRFPSAAETHVPRGGPSYRPAPGAWTPPPAQPKAEAYAQSWSLWMGWNPPMRLETLEKLPNDAAVFQTVAELLRSFATGGSDGARLQPTRATPVAFDELITDFLKRRPPGRGIGETAFLFRVIDRAIAPDSWISQPASAFDARGAMGLITWLSTRGGAREYEALQYLQSRILRVSERSAEVEGVYEAAMLAGEEVWSELPLSYKAILAPKRLLRGVCGLLGRMTGR